MTITIDELLKWRAKYVWEPLDKIARAKGHDYSGSGAQDTFKNIRLVEETMGMPAEIGIMVRLQDKFVRLGNLLTDEWESGELPAVSDESIEDSILDIVNYVTYIYALRAERANGGALPE